MSVTRLAIEKNRITLVALLIVLGAGISSYRTMPQSEDPGFIVRTAFVQTFLPGASPERVENLVTDPLEAAIQQMPELDFVSSESLTGLSIIYVNIKESYKEMRPIWDSLRRKVDNVRGQLPDGVIGPQVNDEFGDVFGILFTITGEGYSYAELRDVADEVRDELLTIEDVAKVDIYGAQEERIFIEYENARLAQLNLSPMQLGNLLESQNILFPGGRISTGDQRIVLEPSGNFQTLEDVRRSVITLPERSEVLYLEDIAEIKRGYVDPARSKLRSSGVPALGIGISMRDGGNIIRMGEDVRALIRHLEAEYPIGIEFDFVAFQPDEVDANVKNFVHSLLQAVGLVVLVMLLTLGVRTGLVVATLIPMTMLMSLWLMNIFGITLNTISLAALIIALGMLVDNAIVMSESIMVMIKRGVRPIEAAVKSARELRTPLLTSSLTTAAAFLSIFLAESTTGEYTADLFKVVTIALMASWVLSLTMVPLFCYRFIKVGGKTEQTFDGRFYAGYRGFLLRVLKHPWISLAVLIFVFLASMQLQRFIPALFFPPSERAFLTAELTFPAGTPIERTEAMVDDLEGFFETSLKVGNDRDQGITNWASFIGIGAPRFYLAANPEPQKEQLACLLINTTTRAAADEIRPRIEEYLWNRYPGLNAVILPLDYGPPVVAPIEVRLSGADTDRLFAVVDEVRARLEATPGTKNIQDNWGPRVKKLMVVVDQPRARRAGVSSLDIAVSLQSILSGIAVTEFREQEDVIPVVMRGEAADRRDIGKLETLDVYSQATGRTVPLKQVADVVPEWEPSTIHRRDRIKTVTISSFLQPEVTATDVVNRLAPWLEEQKQSWPIGYSYEFGGEIESSVEAQQAIMAKLPIAFGVIILLLVGQFNSLRRPLIILLTIPLALIGVNVGLFVLRGNMGFMTFLGVISLAGIVINNAIVLLDRIRIERDELGTAPDRAVIEAAQKRFRPILLTTVTTIGGLLPLYLSGGPMWESMAIAIMFGLIFATGLTLGAVPLFYSLFFKVKFKNFKY
jgi:multidrug efflux pump subunit AcrB